MPFSDRSIIREIIEDLRDLTRYRHGAPAGGGLLPELQNPKRLHRLSYQGRLEDDLVNEEDLVEYCEQEGLEDIEGSADFKGVDFCDKIPSFEENQDPDKIPQHQSCKDCPDYTKCADTESQIEIDTTCKYCGSTDTIWHNGGLPGYGISPHGYLYCSCERWHSPKKIRKPEKRDGLKLCQRRYCKSGKEFVPSWKTHRHPYTSSYDSSDFDKGFLSASHTSEELFQSSPYRWQLFRFGVLATEQNDAVNLCYGAGLSAVKTAKILGISRKKVISLTRSARRRLREAYPDVDDKVIKSVKSESWNFFLKSLRKAFKEKLKRFPEHFQQEALQIIEAPKADPLKESPVKECIRYTRPWDFSPVYIADFNARLAHHPEEFVRPKGTLSNIDKRYGVDYAHFYTKRKQGIVFPLYNEVASNPDIRRLQVNEFILPMSQAYWQRWDLSLKGKMKKDDETSWQAAVYNSAISQARRDTRTLDQVIAASPAVDRLMPDGIRATNPTSSDSAGTRRRTTRKDDDPEEDIWEKINSGICGHPRCEKKSSENSNFCQDHSAELSSYLIRTRTEINRTCKSGKCSHWFPKDWCWFCNGQLDRLIYPWVRYKKIHALRESLGAFSRIRRVWSDEMIDMTRYHRIRNPGGLNVYKRNNFGDTLTFPLREAYFARQGAKKIKSGP